MDIQGYKKTPQGLCINTDNTQYQHIVNRRQINKRFSDLEITVGGIANSLSTIIEMMHRSEQNKLDRNEQ